MLRCDKLNYTGATELLAMSTASERPGSRYFLLAMVCISSQGTMSSGDARDVSIQRCQAPPGSIFGDGRLKDSGFQYELIM